MRIARLATCGAVLASLALSPSPARAQTAAEVRASSTKYRYLDLNHTFSNKLLLDALYIGVPGQNELYLGVGYTKAVTKTFTFIPLLYGVAAKEREERGLVVGAYGLLDAPKWKGVAFLGRFVKISGGVPSYDFADSIDLTRVIGSSSWQLGVSSTIYRYPDGWSHLTGPVLKLTDAKGSWALSVRDGYETEVRLVRVLTF